MNFNNSLFNHNIVTPRAIPPNKTTVIIDLTNKQITCRRCGVSETFDCEYDSKEMLKFKEDFKAKHLNCKK